MRDEILLQLAKQIRRNPNSSAKDRLWYTLAACLSHFPPSQILENYLEIFFVEEWEYEQQVIKQLQQQFGTPGTTTTNTSPTSTASAAPPSLPMQCLRLMHEAIFRFGYNVRQIYNHSHKGESVTVQNGTLSFTVDSIMKINTWIGGELDTKTPTPKKNHQ